MATEARALEPRTYGNFRRPVGFGVNKLGVVGLCLLFGGLLAVILVVALVGLVAAIAPALLLGGGLLAVSVRDKHHRTVLQRAATRIGFAWARHKGATIYRSGPTGRVPYRTFALPGLAAGVQVSEWEDGYGDPFALLHHPGDNSYAVVLSSEPDGAALVDEEQVDSWVAHWGGFLASLAEEPGLVGAAVVIETAPDTGTRLRTEVESNVDPNAHPIAQAVLAECVDTYPAGAASVNAWISCTFSGAASGTGKRRPTEAVAADLGTRLPGIAADLSATGAGAARPATVAELAEAVRVSYDPEIAALFDAARAGGEPVVLDWSEAGPTAADAGWEHLRHDGAVSVTYGMTLPPRGEVFSNVLARLVGPHPDIDRKRVVLLYEPIDPGRAPDVAEADVNNARSRATGPKPTQRSLNDHTAARDNAAAEARGAGLVNFGLLVTATVTDPDRLPAARAAVQNLIGTARIRVRPLHGSQDSAFVCALPLGVVPWRHLRVPADLSEAM